MNSKLETLTYLKFGLKLENACTKSSNEGAKVTPKIKTIWLQEAEIFKFQEGREMPGAGQYRRNLDFDFKVKIVIKSAT